MFGSVILAAWSVAGLAWWIISWRLVRADQRAKTAATSAPLPHSLTIFKPLPALGARGLAGVAAGLESFIAQIDSRSEVLLGAHEADRGVVAPFVEAMREKYPKAQARVIYRSEPDAVANPKIAWQMYLAPHAMGELWLWSDADIVAPPGFLHAARAEFARGGAVMITFPYVARHVTKPGGFLEALFVNAEFYPGVLLLRRFGAVDFGLGSAMLFERDTFLKRVNWRELGEFLADDFEVGQRLSPVRIGTCTLETVPGARTQVDAVRHDLRWAKTIRWNRPCGYFSRLLILPIFGWLAVVVLHPHQIFAWAGLVGMVQADVLAASVICHAVGCRLRGRDWLALEGWSLWRLAVWVLSWLPAPVKWSGRAWWKPRAEIAKSLEAFGDEAIDIP